MTDLAAPGLFRFSLAGRTAPALFLGGWLALIIGLGVAVVGILARGGPASGPLFFVGLAIATVGLILLGGSQSIERRAAALGWIGPSPVLVLGACVTASLTVAGAIGAPLAALGIDLPGPAIDLVGVAIQAFVFLGIVRLLVIGTGALDQRTLGLEAAPAPAFRELVIGAAWAGPVIVVTVAVAWLAVSLAGSAPGSPLPPSGALSGLLLHLVAGALIAPIAEEVVFRGVAVNAWARTAGPRAAIVRSAVLFAIAHVLTIGGDSFGDAARLAAVGAATRLPVGLALAWVYLRRGSLWAPIGLHAVYNGFLIVAGELAAGVAAG